MNSKEIEQSLLLAEHYFRSNNYQFAEEILKKIINQDSTNSKANELLAYIYGNQGNFDLSLQLLRIAANHPDCSAEALYYLGAALLKTQDYKGALVTLKSSIDKAGEFFEALHDIGTAYGNLENTEESLSYYEKCLKLKRNSYELHFNIARCYDDLKLFERAVIHYDEAIKCNPNISQVWYNRGLTLNDLRRYPEAISSYKKAIALDNNYAEAWSNLGTILNNAKEYEEAINCYSKALTLNSNLDFIFGDNLHTKMRLCDWASTRESIEYCIDKINKLEKVIQPFQLLALVDNPLIQKKCAEIYARAKFNTRSLNHFYTNNKNKKIRIGYFSSDFKDHPVTTLTLSLFELHDKTTFEIIGFSHGPDDESPIRKRLIKAFDSFIDTKNKTDLEIVNLSKELKLDIAVDLGGHTSENRLSIFSHRIAPIQVTYIGYIGTLGTNFMDYLIADQVVIPKKNENFYCEKIISLPIYQSSNIQTPNLSKIPKKEDLGIPKNSFIFCCFNNNFKITPEIFNSWMRILRGTVNSVLFLYAENQSIKSNLLKQAKDSGIDTNRLIFANRLSKEDYLLRYCVCDLFLDTFPYNAGTTANDALSMNLPVLTYAGESFVSRMASSLLLSVGLGELVTNSIEEYEARAIELANNPYLLTKLKNHLSKNKQNSNLFNPEKFTRNLEMAFKIAYDRHVKHLSIENIYI